MSPYEPCWNFCGAVGLCDFCPQLTVLPSVDRALCIRTVPLCICLSPTLSPMQSYPTQSNALLSSLSYSLPVQSNKICRALSLPPSDIGLARFHTLLHRGESKCCSS